MGCPGCIVKIPGSLYFLVQPGPVHWASAESSRRLPSLPGKEILRERSLEMISIMAPSCKDMPTTHGHDRECPSDRRDRVLEFCNHPDVGTKWTCIYRAV